MTNISFHLYLVSRTHNELTSVVARHPRNKSFFDNLFRLRLIIREFGSLETDGQFVIGLRDGEGSAILRFAKTANLSAALTTLSNTFLMIEFMK